MDFQIEKNRWNGSGANDNLLDGSCDEICEICLKVSDPSIFSRFQVSTALRMSKPLYLHSRDAEEDFISVMKEFGFGATSKVDYRL